MRQLTYLNEQGEFTLRDAQRYGEIYFPLVNEGEMISSVTPLLAGDCKTGQNTFLLAPASEDSLRSSRDSRNFWVRANGGGALVSNGPERPPAGPALCPGLGGNRPHSGAAVAADHPGEPGAGPASLHPHL